MAIRDDLFQKFGPHLLEALVDELLREINELRTMLNLPPRSKDLFLGTTHNNAPLLKPYNWMEKIEEPKT